MFVWELKQDVCENFPRDYVSVGKLGVLKISKPPVHYKPIGLHVIHQPSLNYVSIFEGGGGRKMLTDAYVGEGGVSKMLT